MVPHISLNLRTDKEDAIKDLLNNLSCNIKEGDQEVLVGGAKNVYQSLKKLSEPLNFKQAEYPMNLDTNIYMKKEKVSFEIGLNELMIQLDNFIKVNEFAKLQFKS